MHSNPIKPSLFKGTAITVLIVFIGTSLGPMPQAGADEFHLPVPGVMVHLSPPLEPPVLKGIKVHSDNPFRFDFILDQGDPSVIKEGDNESLKQEAAKLIKYFLASLTIPEKDLWVNLSPYEKDRIVPQSFGLTEMGRDLLAEDYMLKQITASLIYPEDTVGKKFWKRVYEKASYKFGTTNIPVNTFNKVWVVPDKAVVYENAPAATAYVVESRLKVMLEEDYLAIVKNHSQPGELSPRTSTMHFLGSQIIREIVIPELTKEVNEDKNFTRLRQVYNSLILAAWYKKKIKDSILAQVYADKNKISGVEYKTSVIASPQGKVISKRTINDVEGIYQRYLRAFKKGVYNYIKEDTDPLTQESIPRKYFSGGMGMERIENTVTIVKGASFLRRLLKVGVLGLYIVTAGCTLPGVVTFTPFSQNLQQENIGAVNISQFWMELRKFAGQIGEIRLKEFVDFGNIQEITPEREEVLKSLAAYLGSLNAARFEAIMKLHKIPVSVASSQDNKTAWLKVIARLKGINEAKAARYMDLYRRLFMDSIQQNISLEALQDFLHKMPDNEEKNTVFLESVLKEFPELFNPSSEHSRQYLEEAARKLKSRPPFVTVQDPSKTGFASFNNDNARYLLRRYLLAVLNVYRQAFPRLDDTRFAQTLMTCLFATIGEGYIADSGGQIGYQLLTMPGKEGVLGHEIGHILDLLGIRTNNGILDEFIADIYANALEELSEMNPSFRDMLKNVTDEVKNEIAGLRLLVMVLKRVDVFHEDHYYARLQMAKLIDILGKNGKEKVSWQALLEAAISIGDDYQKGGLNSQVKNFIDGVLEEGRARFDLYIEELIRRYRAITGKDIPATKHVFFNIKNSKGQKGRILLLDVRSSKDDAMAVRESVKRFYVLIADKLKNIYLGGFQKASFNNSRVVVHASLHQNPVLAAELWNHFGEYQNLTEIQKGDFIKIIDANKKQILDVNQYLRREIKELMKFIETPSSLPVMIAYEGSASAVEEYQAGFHDMYEKVRQAMPAAQKYQSLVDEIMLYICGPAIYLKYRGDERARNLEIVAIEKGVGPELSATEVMKKAWTFEKGIKTHIGMLSQQQWGIKASDLRAYRQRLENLEKFYLPYIVSGQKIPGTEIDNYVSSIKGKNKAVEDQMQYNFRNTLLAWNRVIESTQERNRIIVDNLSRYPGHRILILTGLNHFDHLVDLLAQEEKNLGADTAMTVRQIPALTANKGGIDFTADKTPLQIQNAGQEIRVHLDPAMLQQLKNATGFVPVVIDIQPLGSLQDFLGVKNS